MNKSLKRMAAASLMAVTVFSTVPVAGAVEMPQVVPVVAEDGIYQPSAWREVASQDEAYTWLRGNAYMQEGHGNGWVDTTTSTYKKAHDALLANDELSEIKICIVYREGCSWWAKLKDDFKEEAEKVGAGVLTLDVNKYRTGSLIPYYDSILEGATSPMVLYVSADGTTQGMNGCHTVSDFKSVLADAGYDAEAPVIDEQGQSAEKRATYARIAAEDTNRERIRNGLAPLAIIDELNEVAHLRAYEMTQTGVTHTRPDGRDFWTAMWDAGINFTNAGENISGGPSVGTPEAAVDEWIKSSDHHWNMLRPYYNYGVVGYADGDADAGQYKSYWSQIFIEKGTIVSLIPSSSYVVLEPGETLADKQIDIYTLGSDGTKGWIPLIDEMTDFDASRVGICSVTVKVGDLSTTITVQNGDAIYSIDEAELSGLQDTYNYTGEQITPSFTLTHDGSVLVEGEDYEVSYGENVGDYTAPTIGSVASATGTGYIYITGINGYDGEMTLEFSITLAQSDASYAKLEVLFSSVNSDGTLPTYEDWIALDKKMNYGKRVHINLSIYSSIKNQLSKVEDYGDLSDAVDAFNQYAEWIASGAKYDISTATVSTEDGIVVMDGDRELVLDKDYTISGNIITGIGQYAGELSFSTTDPAVEEEVEMLQYLFSTVGLKANGEYPTCEEWITLDQKLNAGKKVHIKNPTYSALMRRLDAMESAGIKEAVLSDSRVADAMQEFLAYAEWVDNL